MLEGDADHQLDVPRPSYISLRSVYAGSAGKFGSQVFWCPQKGHKLQQKGYNRLGTPQNRTGAVHKLRHAKGGGEGSELTVCDGGEGGGVMSHFELKFIVAVYDAQWFLAVTKIVHVASCMGNIDLRARSL